MSTSSSTTVAPVEAGTVYPMPPGPVWATDRRMEEDAVTHHHTVGTFEREPVSGPDGVLEPRIDGVILSRWDTIGEGVLTVGATTVCVLDAELTPQGARELAALLVRAADLAEQS